MRVDQRRRSGQPREAIEDEAAGDCDVQARALADHRDLDAGIGALHEIVWDSLVLVAQQYDRSLLRRLAQRERQRILCEL